MASKQPAGLCPCCGKRPKTASGYCRECHKHYRAVRKRMRERVSQSAEGEQGRRNLMIDGDTSPTLTIPPEIYASIKERGWDPDRVTALALALWQIEDTTETLEDGSVRRCLSYHDKKVYY